MQEAAFKGPMSPIEVYCCNLQVLDPVGDGPKVTYMTTDEWYQAQQADLVLGLVIEKMQDRTLGQCPFMPTDPLEF